MKSKHRNDQIGPGLHPRTGREGRTPRPRPPADDPSRPRRDPTVRVRDTIPTKRPVDPSVRPTRLRHDAAASTRRTASPNTDTATPDRPRRLVVYGPFRTNY